MSFNVGLSGLNAASKDLSVTGNNISNSNTTGFKSSRTEFADAYANSMYLGSNTNDAGTGVNTAAVSQQFTQGSLTETGNALDMAVSGTGFFQVENNGQKLYTRDGTFKTDANGYIVTNAGYNLQGYQADAEGNVNQGAVGDLQLNTANQAPKATTKTSETINLNSSATTPTNTTFDPSDATSYNNSNSVSIYDTQGNQHTMSHYYVKTESNVWNMYTLIDGRNPADPTSTTPYANTLVFDSAGKLSQTYEGKAQYDQASASWSGDGSAGLNTGTTTGSLTLDSNEWIPAAVRDATTTPVTYGSNGATAATTGIALDMSKSTQTATSFSSTTSQDGYTTGQMSTISIADDGKISASYTNGQSKVVGQVVLASFANNQGLSSLGGNVYAETSSSGGAQIGAGKSGTLGSITSGSLEDSNVDLNSELVHLIEAQRNYQANSKTIQTESELIQTIIQMT